MLRLGCAARGETSGRLSCIPYRCNSSALSSMAGTSGVISIFPTDGGRPTSCGLDRGISRKSPQSTKLRQSSSVSGSTGALRGRQLSVGIFNGLVSILLPLYESSS